VLETIPGEVVIDDLTVDKPGPNEIVIRTAACGLCHSDLHVMVGDLPGPVPSVRSSMSTSASMA
jgi:S-(hydroxymethyl)glutathione dehydrogenase/alcohol dehydrogenase